MLTLVMGGSFLSICEFLQPQNDLQNNNKHPLQDLLLVLVRQPQTTFSSWNITLNYQLLSHAVCLEYKLEPRRTSFPRQLPGLPLSARSSLDTIVTADDDSCIWREKTYQMEFCISL